MDTCVHSCAYSTLLGFPPRCSWPLTSNSIRQECYRNIYTRELIHVAFGRTRDCGLYVSSLLMVHPSGRVEIWWRTSRPTCHLQQPTGRFEPESRGERALVKKDTSSVSADDST